MFNSIEDRALSEHRGSGIFSKKSNGKYSLLLPVEGTGENGSTPAQLTKTAVGNIQATSVEGRQENPQKTIPFYAHRDNITILEELKGKTVEFLRLLPDFTAIKYSGTISYKLNNTDVGGLEQGEITITPTSSDIYVENAFSLLEDTALITNSVPEVVEITGTGTTTIAMTTDPSDATLSVASVSGGTAIATGAFGTAATANTLTITGVTAGSTILTVTVTKTGYASFKRSILVIVK